MQLGKFNLQIISAGCFVLDAGTLFGIIPKTIWQKQVIADEKNRTKLALNCLLIQAHGKNILIDCGTGHKFSDKLKTIYKINTLDVLTENLAAFCSPHDIDYVILTHLHFDHAGGLSRYDENHKLKLVFPNAKIIVQKKEWKASCAPNERNLGSYLVENIALLEDYRGLCVVEGNSKILPGIELILTGGHSVGHQVIKIASQDKTALFAGDIIPTTHHLRLPFITSYDIQPETTLKVKKNLLAHAATDNWLLIFEHDMLNSMGYIEKRTDKGKLEYIFQPVQPV